MKKLTWIRMVKVVSGASGYGALHHAMGVARAMGTAIFLLGTPGVAAEDVRILSGSTDLKGSDVTTTLHGKTCWSNSGAAATLTSENDVNTSWGGTLGTGVNLVKTGAGDLNVTATNALCGSVTVQSGTLRLGGGDRVAPVDDGLKLRFDAARADTIETNATGYVTRWFDADGRDYTFSADGVHESPQVRGDLICGRPVLWFEGNHTRLVGKYTNNWCSVKQLFVVFNRAKDSYTGKWGWHGTGVVGWSGTDKGLRFGDSGGTIWADTQWPGTGDDTSYRVNGVATNCITALQTDVHNLTFAGTNLREWLYALAIGDYYAKDDLYRAFRGYFCELLIYDRKLSEEEVTLTESYLMNKWQTEMPSVPACVPKTSVTVAEGATFDMNGASAVLTDLIGEGTVTNSASAVSSLTMAVGAGTISRLTMDLGTNIVLRLDGGRLNLNGKTVHVHRICGRGYVSNGKLVADVNTLDHGLIIRIR